MNTLMTLVEKIKVVLDLLTSKALLSQKTEVNLLLDDVVKKGVDISEALTILDRLQRESKINVQSIDHAPVTKFAHTLRVIENMYTIEYDLRHLDRNQLDAGNVIELELKQPLLNECEALGLNKEDVGNVAKLFVTGDHPQSVKLSCPLCRSLLGEISTDDAWQEVSRGKVFKCKDRRHEVRVTYQDHHILTSSLANSDEEIPSKT